MLKGGRAHIKVTKVLWKFPPSGWLICNTDRASRGNSGRSTHGFCLRNSEGDLVHAQVEDIGITTNTEVEVIAFLEAMKFCRGKGLKNIIIQTDSEMVPKILSRDWKTPWSIAIWVDEIMDISKNMSVTFSHILREGNKLAHALGNQALDKGSFQCQSFQDLEVDNRNILNSDKAQIPYLRIRTTN
ncbi:uncharacterized protein LOC132043913 [Lycium ferocissimum]|uniref:uncharacterized protein LOC132043913 n=1 Tax=Lycium ferocissimum TaxID=112874 RepID=UPI0028161596|nr:uncharacterized protein LOC132043913 [Lycium ferocissimum]